MILRMIRSTVTAAAPAEPSSFEARRDLVDRIMDELHHFVGELRCAGTERLVRAGVSMSHLHVMGLLARDGDAPMSRVADLLDVSLSNATGMVDRMAERGFVERVRVADDRRIVLVRLTDRGRAVLDEAEVIRRDLVERLLAQLEPSQLERLALTLADVHAAVAGLVVEEGPAPCLQHDTRRGPHAHACTPPTGREEPS